LATAPQSKTETAVFRGESILLAREQERLLIPRTPFEMTYSCFPYLLKPLPSENARQAQNKKPIDQDTGDGLGTSTCLKFVDLAVQPAHTRNHLRATAATCTRNVVRTDEHGKRLRGGVWLSKREILMR